uniref:Uncharacterized protein n=1 Tax=Salix viminalis TaxID=40686 RepID=A0A6N2KHK5_SALVM
MFCLKIISWYFFGFALLGVYPFCVLLTSGLHTNLIHVAVLSIFLLANFVKALILLICFFVAGVDSLYCFDQLVIQK